MRSWIGRLCAGMAACTTLTLAADPAAEAYLAGDYERARGLLLQEVRARDARPSRYLLLGRVYFLLDEWREARQVVEELLERDPDNPHGRELLGRVLFRQGQARKALPFYEESLRHFDRPALRLELAEIHLRLGRTTDAIAALKRVVDDQQGRPRAHYLLGRLYLDIGVGYWASEHLWRALRLGSRESDLRARLAQAYFLEGQTTGPLTTAGPVADGRASAVIGDQILVRRLGPPREDNWLAAGPNCALYQCETAIADAGNHVDGELYLLAARCWLAAGDIELAAARLANAPDDHPDAPRLRIDLALAKRDVDATLASATGEALAQLPPDTAVRPLLDGALVALAQDRHDDAQTLLRRADTIQPGRSDVLRMMVETSLQMDEGAEALAKLKLLAELHPDSPQLNRLLQRQKLDPVSVGEQGLPVIHPPEED